MPIEIKELRIRVEVPETGNASIARSPQHIFVDSSDDLWIGRDETPDQLVLDMGTSSGETAPGGFAVDADTSQYPDHKNWINVTSCNMGGHRSGSGAAGDDAPVEEVSFAYAQSSDGGGWIGGGRDLLIGGAGADHIDAGASANNRGRLVVGVDDVRLMAMFDGFDLV